MLVIDLDHTLLHTTQDAQLASRLGFGRSPEIKQIQLFDRSTGQHQLHFVRLRPGCHEFLARCAMRYKLFINTHATRPYALAVINLIDPHGTYFGGRIMARTQDPPLLKSLNQLLHEYNHLDVESSMIVDDRLDVWNSDELESIVRIEPYVFFRPLQQMTLDTCSEFDDELSSVDMDDQLMHVGDVLLKVELLYREYHELKTKKLDVRKFLRHLRSGVLTNVSVCFDSNVPYVQQMHAYARLFGANVTSEVLRGATTHLVTNDAESEKSRLARRSEVKCVSLSWLTTSMGMFQRQSVSNHQVVLPQMSDDEDVQPPEIEPLFTRYKD